MQNTNMLQHVNDLDARKQLTAKQEAFVQYTLDGKEDWEIQELLDIDEANRLRMERNPLVASEVFVRAAANLRNKVFPLAVRKLETIMRRSDNDRNVISAAKTVLAYEQAGEMMRARMPGGLQKPVEEFSQAELRDRAAAIRAELRAIDREKQARARDVTPAEDGPDTIEG